jgi:hypothetical protein
MGKRYFLISLVLVMLMSIFAGCAKEPAGNPADYMIVAENGSTEYALVNCGMEAVDLAKFSALLNKRMGAQLKVVNKLPESGKGIFIGVADKIDAVLGDAREMVPELKQEYDMIFMDAAKGQYQEFLDIADRILKLGGLLVADNVLINGWVVNLNYPRHRQKTMVYRMKAFLEQFKENTWYQCSVIPLGDGVALIRKRKETNEK